MTDLKIVTECVLDEVDAQKAKWGIQNHNDLYWLGIAMEELGEVAKEVIEHNGSNIDEELIQAAAVLISWLECRERKAREREAER
jgi:hypothetical protein